jgi:glycosyltransferase involved in cell wall biosynthesis
MKKNILIFGHGYNLPFVDVYNQYAKLFDDEHYEVTTAYLVGAANESVKQQTHASHVYFLNQSSQKIRGAKFSAIKRLWRLCREKQFDTIICHRYKPFYIIALIACFTSIPHIFAVMHTSNTLKRWRRRLFTYLFARKKITFIGVSDFVTKDIKHCAPWLKSITLPNSIDVAAFEQQLLSRETARQQLKLTNNDFVFGNIARLAKEKEQLILIKAFAQLSADYPQSKLIFIGTGKLEQVLKEEVKYLKLDERIIFAGFIPNAARLLKAFDVFILPSSVEGCSFALLEAMTAQLPIIASNIPSNQFTLNSSDSLVPVRDINALTKAMQNLIQTPAEKLQIQGTNNYQKLIANFSLPTLKKLFWNTRDNESLY